LSPREISVFKHIILNPSSSYGLQPSLTLTGWSHKVKLAEGRNTP
jgi:hypothetical protein